MYEKQYSKDYQEQVPNILDLTIPSDLITHRNRVYVSSYNLKGGWKNEKRNKGHSMHKMASRTGSFPPSLANYFIRHFSSENQKILDPFSGKGTTVLESCLLNREGIGIDIAPEAYSITVAKTNLITIQEANYFLEKLVIPPVSKLEFDQVPEDVKIFYHNNVLKQILGFKKVLKNHCSLEHLNYDQVPYYEQKFLTKEVKLAQYWTGILLGILHGSSQESLSLSCSHSYSMSPNYVAKYAEKNGLVKPNRDIKECLLRKSNKLLRDGNISRPGRAILGSAMKLPNSLKGKIDLIVTSPPYFDAQSYSWDNWLREWYLGFNYKDVKKQLLETSSEKKYREAIRLHLQEAYKTLKKERWAFYVVGDIIKKNRTGSYKIITAELLAQEAEGTGFRVELIINDDIPRNNCYFSSYLKENQGVKLDRIVCLYKA